MDDDSLVEVAATDAAREIWALEPASGPETRPVEVDFGSCSALMLIPGEPVNALVWGMMADAAPDYELDSETMEELGFLPSPDSAAWRELASRIDNGDTELYEPYFLALAAKVRALVGIPVLVHELGSYQEQLALQEHAAVDADLLRGLDVLVSLQVDDVRVAVVYRDATGQVWRTGSYGHEDPVPGLGRWAALRANPVVLAGILPAGAATVQLRVGATEAWVEPDARSRGFWICALSARALSRDPELRYCDVDGVEFDVDVPFDGPELPELWPAQAPSPAHRVTDGGAQKTVEGGGWLVDVTDVGPLPVKTPSELVGEHFAVEPVQVPSKTIVGSVLGHRHGFELAARDDIWIAVADCGGIELAVKGNGEPPSRLDLEPFEQT